MQTNRMIARALRDGWEFDPKFRGPLVERQIEIGLDRKEKSRDATRAFMAVIQADKINKDVAFKLLDKTIPDQLEHRVHEDTRQSIATLQADPEYVEYLRHKAIERDCDTGIVCGVRESGNGQPVENGSPPGDIGSGANGHRDGAD